MSTPGARAAEQSPRGPACRLAGRAPCAGSRCGRSGRRRPSATGAGRGEVLGVEAVRDRDARARASSGNARTRRARLLRVHDDGGRRREHVPHPPQVAPPVEPARIDLHLVERPGIAEVGDPRARRAAPAMRAATGAGLEGRHRGVHEFTPTPRARRPRRPAPTSGRRPPAGRASAPRGHARPRDGPGGSASILRTVVPAGTSEASESSAGVQRLPSTRGPVTTTGS